MLFSLGLLYLFLSSPILQHWSFVNSLIGYSSETREKEKKKKLSKDWNGLSKQWITIGHNTTTEGMLIFWQHAHSILLTRLFLLQTHTHTHINSLHCITVTLPNSGADQSRHAVCPRVAIPVRMVPIRWHLQHMTQTDGRMCHCKRLHFQIRGVGQVSRQLYPLQPMSRRQEIT